MVYQEEFLTLSDVRIIGQTAINAHSTEASSRVDEICAHYGIKSANYPHYTTMPRFLFPDASLERLVTLTVLLNTFYYIDDYINIEDMRQEDLEGRAFFSQCLKIFQTACPAPSENRLFELWAWLHERFISQSNQTYLNEFVEAVACYLQMTTYSLDRIFEDGQLDIQKCIDFRLTFSGMYVCLDLVEFAHNITLPKALKTLPDFQELRYHVAFYGAFLNDIFSYSKEIKAGNRLNLVNVLMEAKGYTLAEAIHEIVESLNDTTQQFLKLQEKLIYAYSDNMLVLSYLQGLHDVFAASWHWQISTNRYRSADSLIPELQNLL